MKHSVTLFLALLLAALLQTGCSLLPDMQDETRGWSAQKLFTEAKSEMADGGYEKAIKYFETLEARYPYGRYAQQAQLEVAYAYFKSNEPISAIAACDRFIKLHPNHPSVDYAHYLKGLANFNEDLGLFGSLSKQDMSERDPKAARESFESFKELSTRFPNSKYTPDAVARMKYLVNALASHEVHVARYYFKRGAYVAVVNRSQSALKLYPQAPATEEALALMVKAYDAMGMTDLREDTMRVMHKNFPDSRYFKQGSNDTPWWKLW
ncbi:MAG: outer membrane protein assembly factor BamD [Sulfuricellaceae bacterium]